MVFDPILIVLQIIALQCFYYIALGSALTAAYAIFSTPLSMDHFFTSAFVNFASGEGVVHFTAAIISSFVGAVLLYFIVERSRKCVDFTVTLFIIHVVEFPRGWEWWIAQVIACVVMAALGEYLCSKKELRDIPLYTPEDESML